jgi:hypothetical protein
MKDKIWLVIALAALTAFFWKVPLLTQDGPNHKKVAVILSRLSESPVENRVYGSQFGAFQPNSLFPLLYLPLSRTVSPDLFEKIFLWSSLVLLVLSFRFFLSRWSPGDFDLWPIILPALFQPLYLIGMYNYLASIPFAFFALGFLRRGLETRRWSFFFPWAFFCWVSFVGHPFPAIVLSLCLALMALTEFRAEIKRGIVYALPLIFLLGRGFVEPLFQKTPAGVNTVYSFLFLPAHLGGLLAFNFPAYSGVQMVTALPFFAILIFLMVSSFRKVEWKYKKFWIAMLLGYLSFPIAGAGGGHLNQRFLPFLWMFLPLGIALSPQSVKWIRAASFLTALAMGIFVFCGMTLQDRQVQDAKKVLAEVPNGARLYPINFDMKGGVLTHSPLTHSWALYPHDKVVFSPYLFAFRDLMPLSRKIPASETYFPATSEDLPSQLADNALCHVTSPVETFNCEEIRQEGIRKILAKAFYYDYWFVHSPPPDVEAALEAVPGLEKVANDGAFSLWHYKRSKEFQPPL